MTGQHTGTRPVRLRVHDTELATQVLRTIGYQGRCACGWLGPVRGRYDQARLDGQAHRRENHRNSA